MKPVLTPAEMAAWDQATIAAGTPVSVLMDRAGRAVAWEVRRRLGGTYGARVVVVCGPGNNGGDGRVAAAVLRSWGVRVAVFALAGSSGGRPGEPSDEPSDAPFDAPFDADAFDVALRRADMLVDAMYGTGLRSPLDGAAALVARRSREIPTVAVDIPSGVDGATGAVVGDAVQAVVTVTFAARKRGHCFEPGRSRAGEIMVADIGIDRRGGGSAELEPMSMMVERSDIAAWLPTPAPETNKWNAAVLVVGGSTGMVGAPLLVSRAAMRTGARLVWCAVPGIDAAGRAGGTEVIARALPATAAGALSGFDDDLRAALGRFRAAAVGPGLGVAPETRTAIRELVAAFPGPLVLDADGLNAFAGDARALRSRAGPTVLTPHAAEFERLLGEPVGIDRVAAARRLAEASGCITLLKGPGTVIAHPDGRLALNPADGPWLGTAGSGDALSGIIAGFLARGIEAFEAAAGAALVHGLAADAAGHTGLVAGDIVAALPRTLDRLTGFPVPGSKVSGFSTPSSPAPSPSDRET